MPKLLFLSVALALLACGEPTCKEACAELVEKYGECREDINDSACVDLCDGGDDEKEVLETHACLEDNEFACEAYSGTCDSEIFIRIAI